jgi:hypothetical protein
LFLAMGGVLELGVLMVGGQLHLLLLVVAL